MKQSNKLVVQINDDMEISYESGIQTVYLNSYMANEFVVRPDFPLSPGETMWVTFSQTGATPLNAIMLAQRESTKANSTKQVVTVDDAGNEQSDIEQTDETVYEYWTQIPQGVVDNVGAWNFSLDIRAIPDTAQPTQFTTVWTSPVGEFNVNNSLADVEGGTPNEVTVANLYKTAVSSATAAAASATEAKSSETAAAASEQAATASATSAKQSETDAAASAASATASEESAATSAQAASQSASNAAASEQAVKGAETIATQAAAEASQSANGAAQSAASASESATKAQAAATLVIDNIDKATEEITAEATKQATEATQQAVEAESARAQGKEAELQSDIEGLREDIETESHFRGYLATNAEIQALTGTPNDYAYSAESGTVWIYQTATGWTNSGKPVPDKTVPASDTVPLMDGTGSAGSSEGYARGDHRHPTDTTRASTAVATTSANGLMSSADKTKLNGVEAGAQKNLPLDTAMSETSENPVQNKVIKSYVDTSIANAITTALNTPV